MSAYPRRRCRPASAALVLASLPMREILASTPTWVVVVVLFAYFLTLSLGCRAYVLSHNSKKRRDELADQASRLLTGVAATFALFVGFSITVTTDALDAGQKYIENHAAQAKELVWTFDSVSNRKVAQQLQRELRTYLLVSADEDPEYLQTGNTLNLPSAKPLDRLEKSIHRYAFSPETSDSDESAIVDAAASLNNSAAAITAVAHRTLPTLLVVLLLVVGSMIAAITGISFADMSRPILLPIWSLIPALSIAVIPGPADIGLDLEPLRAIAEALSTKL